MFMQVNAAVQYTLFSGYGVWMWGGGLDYDSYVWMCGGAGW